MCDAARAFRVPVLVDASRHAAVVDMFAPQYPDVNSLVPHQGASTTLEGQRRVVDQPSVTRTYTDTSGIRRFITSCRPLNARPRKVLFGRTARLHRAELHKVKLLGLPSAAESLILGGNLLRLIRPGRVTGEVARPPQLRSARTSSFLMSNPNAGLPEGVQLESVL